jgi:D-psicose/D-tagatose/L-ribulose 3-epimerase
MKIGINTFLFASPFTNASTSWFLKFKEWGFDFVEIVVEDPTNVDAELVLKALQEAELECRVVCAATGPGRDLRGTRKEQVDCLYYIQELLNLAVLWGAKVVTGPIYSSVGRAELTPKSDYLIQWKVVVDNLRLLASVAEDMGIKIGIEPLNRYETDFINTCEQALKLIEDVGSPALGVHLDSFHMNLEEKYQSDAILKAADKLVLLHASGSDRGTPGKDHIDWESIFEALRSIQYQGDISIESFTPEVKVIAKAASIWRKIEPSSESIAVEGLKFLQAQRKKSLTS